MWTPETNRWINPKYAVKDTPEEQLQFGKEIFEQKDYKVAMNEFQKLIKHYPKSREAPEAQLYIGECYEGLDQQHKAFEEYQKIISKYPFSDLAPEVVEREYNIGEKLLKHPGKNKIVQTIIGAEYDVIDVFRTVIKNAPYGQYAPVSQYKIGLYLMEKKMYQEARDELEKVINDYPDSEWVKPARYQIALVDSARSGGAEYDQKVTRAAVEEFEDFVSVYPDAELSKKAKEEIALLQEKDAENNFLIAKFYQKQKKYEAAKIYYKSVIDGFPGSPWATKAEKKISDIEKQIQKQKK